MLFILARVRFLHVPANVSKEGINLVVAKIGLTIHEVEEKDIAIWKETIAMRAQGVLTEDQIVEWRKDKIRQLIEEALDETVENRLSRAEVTEATRKVARAFEQL